MKTSAGAPADEPTRTATTTTLPRETIVPADGGAMFIAAIVPPIVTPASGLCTGASMAPAASTDRGASSTLGESMLAGASIVDASSPDIGTSTAASAGPASKQPPVTRQGWVPASAVSPESPAAVAQAGKVIPRAMSRQKRSSIVILTSMILHSRHSTPHSRLLVPRPDARNLRTARLFARLNVHERPHSR